MPLTTVIVDDEQLARDELAFLLEKSEDVQVVAQGKNGLEAVSLIKEHTPDLVFLDVQMPGLDGFGVIKRLLDRKLPMPQVIFATAFDQYAVKAFEVNAVDYLLKPFDKKRVLQAVEKARHNKHSSEISPNEKLETLVRLLEQQTAKSEPSKVMIRSAGRLMLVDQKEICYASIEDGVISVVTHTMEGHSNCRTLEELLESLDSNLFWRAHRGFVVRISIASRKSSLGSRAATSCAWTTRSRRRSPSPVRRPSGCASCLDCRDGLSTALAFDSVFTINHPPSTINGSLSS